MTDFEQQRHLRDVERRRPDLAYDPDRPTPRRLPRRDIDDPSTRRVGSHREEYLRRRAERERARAAGGGRHHRRAKEETPPNNEVRAAGATGIAGAAGAAGAVGAAGVAGTGVPKAAAAPKAPATPKASTPQNPVDPPTEKIPSLADKVQVPPRKPLKAESKTRGVHPGEAAYSSDTTAEAPRASARAASQRPAPQRPASQRPAPQRAASATVPPSKRPAGARPVAKRKRRPRISVTQVIGEILLTVGVLFFLFAFYEAYWTNVNSGRLQAQAAEKLDDKWSDTSSSNNPRKKLTPDLGEAFARMYIPSFGSDFHFAVVEGTSDEDLQAGPGRYVDTQLPGQPGNFAVAGHRVGKGAPFNDLGNLQVCNAIVVETQNSWDVYRVMPIDSQGEQRHQEALNCFSPEQADRMTSGDYANVLGRSITIPGDVGVIYPIPGQGDIGQTDEHMEKLITLTTCHPQFSNAERMIVHGMMTESIPKAADGSRPAVLDED